MMLNRKQLMTGRDSEGGVKIDSTQWSFHWAEYGRR